MSRHAVVLFALLLSACSDKSAQMAAAPGVAAMSEAPAPENKYLAYEHSVTFDVPAEKIEPIFESGQAACRAAVAESCAILEARITKGEYASASLKLRTTAKGVRDLIQVLSAQGEIASRSTSAEDLAGPIEDAAKKIAMLTDYRQKLEALRGKGNADVESLIKLTRELAQVQSDLEALTGSHAQLMQRVETEILNVSISSYHNRSFWSPIGESVSGFGEDLSEAIGVFITSLAYLIPWALLVTFGIWIWRKLRKRKKATP